MHELRCDSCDDYLGAVESDFEVDHGRGAGYCGDCLSKIRKIMKEHRSCLQNKGNEIRDDLEFLGRVIGAML